MLNNIKQIEVNGKKYTLTARRSILFKIAQICPELVKIAKSSKSETKDDLQEEEVLERLKESGTLDAVDKLYDNMPSLFYELIRWAHKDITQEKSEEIYWDFYDEYNDVDEYLYAFMARTEKHAYVVIRVEDNNATETALVNAGFYLITDADIQKL